MIPYGRQSVDDDDIDAVVKVLRSDFLTQGPAVAEFEERLVFLTGAKHAVAVANGTAALHAAVAAAGIGAGDRLVTTPLTFAASANCGRYVGAGVGFVDIDEHTLNVDVTRVPAGVDALVAVHYAGLPVALDQLAHRPRVVIEDAAHAIGASTADGPVGSCAHSDMTIFSFHPVKTVTTGEGGAITTNDDELAARLRAFRSHGMQRPEGAAGWYYEIDEIGFNYRLTDIHAALGTSQLGKLDRFVRRRNELADRYDALLAGHPQIELPPRAPDGARHGRHLYPVRVAGRDRVYDAMRAQGIGVQVHYLPVHLHPAYRALGFRPGDFPVAEHACARLLSLPLFPDLTETEQDRVVEVLTSVV